MNTVNRIAKPLRQITLALVLILMALGGSACQKRCGAQAGQLQEPFRSITDTPWRLVETTRRDNLFDNLDKFNFRITLEKGG